MTDSENEDGAYIVAVNLIEKAQSDFELIKRSVSFACKTYEPIAKKEKVRHLLKCISVVRTGLEEMHQQLLDQLS